MKKILLVALIGLGFSNLNAQNSLTTDKDNDFGVIYPDYVGISRPLSEIWAESDFDVDAPTQNEINGTEAMDKRHVKRKPQTFEFTSLDGYIYSNDSTILQNEEGTRPAPGTRANYAGIGSGGMWPYDPSGAAGMTHYVQAVNATTYKIYNKATGANMGGGQVGDLWTPVTGNLGDPIIMYDRFANRWFISQFGNSNKIYIAVSTTSDPTGSYYTYSYTSPQFPDYLKFSIWHDGYYMTSNQSQKVFAFERSVMLTGGTARSIYKTFAPPQDPGGGFFVPMPGDADGTSLPTSGGCPIFSYEDNGWGGTYADQINIYEMNTTWGTTPAATITVAAGSPLNTNAFDGSYNANWLDISQPGTSQKLDGIGGIIQYRAQWRKWSTYNSVVICWPVQITASKRGIMWAELRQTGTTWSIFQQGIYNPDGYSRWCGSIAMDDGGNIALCYAKSASSSVTPVCYPSLGYTGRLASDPAGTMTFAETIAQTGTANQQGVERFGDYAQTSLDPADGSTFWHTGMYLAGTSGSNSGRTRIYSFQLASVLNANVSITSNDADNTICSGTSVTFTATPTNGGTTPSYQWKKNGVNAGTNSATYTPGTLANGDIITCVMTSNLPGVLNNPATSNAITMTVNPIVTPAVSIAITTGSNPSCAGSSLTFTATPTNGGTPSYQWKKNGNNVGTNSVNYSNASLANGDIISCVMTSTAACATASTATSNSITMTINPTVTPTISVTSPDITLCAGETTTFTANITNGGTTPAYQWKKNGNNVGTNSSTYSPGTLANGDVITCVLTSNATCPSPATATSTAVTVTITTVPTPTITQNGNILTSSSSTGNQWYLDGNLLVGQTGQNITVTSSGVYTVIVTTNGCSSNASAGNNATVGINEENNPYLMVIFPNPNDGNFTVTFSADKSEKYKLELFNELGQVIISQEISNHGGTYQFPVNLVKPAAGMYTIVLTNGKQESYKKVIVY